MVNHYFSRYKVSEMSRRNTLLTKQRKNVYKFERLNIPLFTIWLHFNYICIRTKLQPFFLFSNCLLQSLLFDAYKRARPITKTSVEFIRLRNSSFDSTQFELKLEKREKQSSSKMNQDRWHAFYKCHSCGNRIGTKIIYEYNHTEYCYGCDTHVAPIEQVSYSEHQKTFIECYLIQI